MSEKKVYPLRINAEVPAQRNAVQGELRSANAQIEYVLRYVLRRPDARTR